MLNGWPKTFRCTLVVSTVSGIAYVCKYVVQPHLKLKSSVNHKIPLVVPSLRLPCMAGIFKLRTNLTKSQHTDSHSPAYKCITHARTSAEIHDDVNITECKCHVPFPILQGNHTRVVKDTQQSLMRNDEIVSRFPGLLIRDSVVLKGILFHRE